MCSDCVSAVSGHLDAGLQRPEPPLLQQPQPTERHTASAASAWLEPQRLPVRSLRLPPAWNFSQDFQIQAPLQQYESTRVGVRASVPPEPLMPGLSPSSLVSSGRAGPN